MFMLIWIPVIYVFILKSQIIVDKILRLFFTQKDKRALIKKLKNELNNMSITLDYTKYIKLNRTIISLESSKSSAVNDLQSKWVVQQGFTIILQGLLDAGNFFLMVLSFVPVMTVKPGNPPSIKKAVNSGGNTTKVTNQIKP
uniref:CSON014948 protein n=1 Tax=Culicoides sonorensis TaxID=179676 RepID=A0A336K5K4_CULSO